MHEGAEIQVGTCAIAEWLDKVIPNQDVVIILLGFASAIVDNAAGRRLQWVCTTCRWMPRIWQFIAYSAGTGGSMLIIGSAAGVAAMGWSRIGFIWYLRKIAWLALIGFLAGANFSLLTFVIRGLNKLPQPSYSFSNSKSHIFALLWTFLFYLKPQRIASL